MAKEKPGDITAAINKLYSYGRTYPARREPPRPEQGWQIRVDQLPTDYPKPDPKQQAVQDPEGKPARYTTR